MALHYGTSRSGTDIIGVFVWYSLKIDENRRARVKDGLTEHDRAKAILDKVLAALAKTGEECSVDIRLYLMEIGAAEHPPGLAR
jgi:hypothetical protein